MGLFLICSQFLSKIQAESLINLSLIRKKSVYQRKKERVGLHFIISLFLSSHSRSGATKAPRTKAPHGPDWLICRRECPYGMECIHNKCVRTKRAFDVLNREFHRQRDQPSGQQSENAEYLCNPPCKLPNICSDAGLCLPLE